MSKEQPTADPILAEDHFEPRHGHRIVDPREKPGVIGEFNRAFTISEAIEKFKLPYVRVR